jgi:hypothetical protein
MNSVDLEGGYLWKNVLYWWPLNDLKKQQALGIPEMNETSVSDLGFENPKLKHSFKVFHNNTIRNRGKHPILIFFTGLGKTKLLTRIHLHHILTKNEKEQLMYPSIFTLDHMSIDKIEDTVIQACELYDYVCKKHPDNPKLLLGHSLGAGVAAQVASYASLRDIHAPPAGLMLLSASPNITFALKPLEILKETIKNISKMFLGNILDTEAALKYVNCPVKIIHTQNDMMFYLKAVEPLSKIKSIVTKKYPNFVTQEGNHGELMSNDKKLFQEIKDFIFEIKV